MTPERFARIGALFDLLIDLPADARAARLLALTDDAEVRAEVASMLAADARADGFVARAQALRTAGALSLHNDEAAPVSQRFGAWHAIRELGRGGMGEVFLVERVASGFEQLGALKQIRRGIGSEAVVTRFLRERQLLARLEHPHIARLLDGGVGADGQPWFVMEFIDGQPLLQWCAAAALDVTQRLQLFDAICSAVAFAHRQLIVHRDIKPANVLVTHSGEVKLLDFGIAALLTADEESAETSGKAHATPLTPQYASPEQLRGLPVSTAIDVYALGALLYELLSGQRPYAMAAGSAAPDWLKILDGPECPPPSQATAHTRPSVPPLMPTVVAGDLDLIAMTALRRQPELRYASVDSLRADLAAWQLGRPIAARGNSASYRMQKFFARHRLAVAAAGIAIAALLTLTTLAINRGMAAQQEAARAAAVQGFLTSLFDASDPELAAGGFKLSARDVVAAGARRIEVDFADRPELRAQLSMVIGRVQFRLGDMASAIALLSWEDTQPQILPGGAGREPRRRAWLAEADTFAGQLDAAATEIDRLAALGAVSAEVSLQASAQRLRSELLRARGDRAGALVAARSAVAFAERGNQSDVLIDSLLTLASALRETDGRAEARAVIERALSTLADGQRGDPRRPAAELELAALLREAGSHQAAIAEVERALGLLSARWPETHPLQADAISLRAALAADAGDLQAAVTGERQALALLERALGADSMLTGGHRSALAFALRRAGDKPAALAMYRQAIDTFTRMGNADHPYAINAMSNAALLMDELGDGAGAEVAARGALAASMRTLGPQASATASRMYTLSTLLRRHGEAAEAQMLADSALAIDDALADLPPQLRVQGIRIAAQAHAANREFESAYALFERALHIDDSSTATDAANRIDILIQYALALQAGAAGERAIEQARAAVALGAAVDPERNLPRSATALTTLGTLLASTPVHREEAQQVLSTALQLLHRQAPLNSADIERAQRALDALR